MTKYSVSYSLNFNVWTPVALYSSDLPQKIVENFCDYLFEIEGCTGVEVTDLETGAVIYGIYEEEEPEDEGLEFDNCDDDCGFDPYLGCYTDEV